MKSAGVIFLALLFGLGRAETAAPRQPSLTLLTADGDAQSIEGMTYINHIAHFSLAVPPSWRVTGGLMKTTPDVVGTIAAPQGGVAIMIQRWDDPVTPEIAKQRVQSSFSKGIPGFRKTDDSPMQIDGQRASSLTFHFDAVRRTGTNVPAGGMFVVWIRNGDGILEFTCEAPDPLFDETKSTFEKIVSSYHYSASL